MADILLSYERTDRQRVAPIVALLKSRGWSVAWDPADEADAQADAQCIIAAWSFDSVESDAVWAVASRGFTNDTLVSVSIDFSRPPRELDAAPSLTLAGWTGDESSPKAQDLLAAVGERLARAGAGRVPARSSAQVPVAAAAPPVADTAPAPATEPVSSAALHDEPEEQPEPEEQWPPAFEPEPEAAPLPRWQRPSRFRARPDAEAELGVEFDPTVPEPLAEPVPALVLREGTSEPVWAYPEGTAEEDQRPPHLPPVLLRERGVPVLPPLAEGEEELQPEPARRRGAAGLLIGVAACLAIAVAGALWMSGWPTGSPPDSKVTAVERGPVSEPAPTKTEAPKTAAPGTDAGKSVAVPAEPDRSKETKAPGAKHPEAKPQEAKTKEVQPTPAALPKEKDVAIEDILGQVTPRVEQLLADASKLIRIHDFRGARQVLAAPETATSGSLTFLLAETYDPNVLPATLKATLGNAERARTLYRKARDLGDGRAQARLDALKTS